MVRRKGAEMKSAIAKGLLRKQMVFIIVVIAVMGVMLVMPASSAQQRYSKATLEGTWSFSETYFGPVPEAAFVGTISFDGDGSCKMSWVGVTPHGGAKPGNDTCTYDVAPDGSGSVIPDRADDLYFQISQRGKRVDYVIDSSGRIGNGSMTKL